MNLLQERWVLTLATSPRPDAADPADSQPHVPYPTPLFYAVADLPGPPMLVFASRPDSTHGRHLGDGPTAVAAGLYLECETVAELRGVQLRGEVIRVAAAPAAAALHRVLRAAYVGRHPAADALLRPGARDELYLLAVTWAKLTDNRHGFGHKLEWRFTTPATFFAGP